MAAKIFEKSRLFCEFADQSGFRAMVNERLCFEVVGGEPCVAAVAAFAKGWGYGAEKVAVGGAVVVHDALDTLAVACGVELFVLFGAGSGGGAHSVSGHFGCHIFGEVL